MSIPIEKLVIIEKITERIQNRYEAVRVMAREARRLNSLVIRGAEPEPDFKPTSTSVKRLINGKISYQGHAEASREYIHVVDAARASVAALGEEFRNESVVLTGAQPMKVLELMKMLAEILGIPDAVEFRNEHNPGHYVRTPYAWQPRLGRKYSPPLHVDLGQGLLELIEEVRREL